MLPGLGVIVRSRQGGPKAPAVISATQAPVLLRSGLAMKRSLIVDGATVVRTWERDQEQLRRKKKIILKKKVLQTCFASFIAQSLIGGIDGG